MNLKSSLAELIGTFTLCFVGAGSIITDAHTGGAVGLLGIALAHGLALAVAVSATMNVSGGQINPAITIGAICAGKEKPAQGVANIIGQCLGGIIAGGLLVALFPVEAVKAVAVGTPMLGEGVSVGAGIALEVIATFLLAMAVYGTAVGSKAPQGMAGFGIGLTVTFLILAIGPLTGGAMNPARHLGTAVFGGQIGSIWIYWVGPVIGGILGFLVCSRVFENEDGKD
jgi:MIP family channel proteins